MPRISQFYGIIITMYYKDHQPPHFHARYAEYKAEYTITKRDLIAGDLPRRAAALVLEWAALHEDELIDNWERSRQQAPLEPIAPLE